MKNFEILQGLPKYYTETQSEQMLLEKLCQKTCLNAGLPQTFSLLKKKKKNAVYAKRSKEKHNKMRKAYTHGPFANTDNFLAIKQFSINFKEFKSYKECSLTIIGIN